MRPLLRTLEVLSALETVSVIALFANLFSVHNAALAATLGPIHGALFLVVAVTALFAQRLLLRTRLMALVPLLGGLFTLINVRKEARR